MEATLGDVLGKKSVEHLHAAESRNIQNSIKVDILRDARVVSKKIFNISVRHYLSLILQKA